MKTPHRTLAAIAFALLVLPVTATAQDDNLKACNQNAMIVFDASGSMAGSASGDTLSPTSRLEEALSALKEALPGITEYRKVGLITYGPGPAQQCNVNLHFAPIPNAAQPILSAVSKLNAAGKTPLTAAVKKAAEVLNYRTSPGTVVLLTDGEETCGGAPCALGKKLAATGHVTVHVIAYRMKGVEWMGEQSILDVQCLAHATHGEYIEAESREDLVKAFQRTLGCPLMSALPSEVAPGRSLVTGRTRIAGNNPETSVSLK